MICEYACPIRKCIRLSGVCIHLLRGMYTVRTSRLEQCPASSVCTMAEGQVHKISLSSESSEETESDTESKGCKRTRPTSDVEHTPSSSTDSPSAANTEGTPGVVCNPNADVRLIENTKRFKDMPLGEKYEGRYQFTNVDQADKEVSVLTGEVEV